MNRPGATKNRYKTSAFSLMTSGINTTIAAIVENTGARQPSQRFSAVLSVMLDLSQLHEAYTIVVIPQNFMNRWADPFMCFRHSTHLFRDSLTTIQVKISGSIWNERFKQIRYARGVKAYSSHRVPQLCRLRQT